MGCTFTSSFVQHIDNGTHTDKDTHKRTCIHANKQTHVHTHTHIHAHRHAYIHTKVKGNQVERDHTPVCSLADYVHIHKHTYICTQTKGNQVERDYTPISSLAEYASGRLILWIRIYSDGQLTPELARISGIPFPKGSPVASIQSSAAVDVKPPELTLKMPPVSVIRITYARYSQSCNN
jgi:hypothetical protein